MHNRDPFSGFHPVVNFLYFAEVIGAAMFLMHPVSLGISLGSAVAYSVRLKGRNMTGRSLRRLLPMMLLAAAVNPAFNHRGATVLLYLPSGNPLTMESLLYGLAAAVMLAAAITWFSCFHEVMTSDKLLYLFGRVIPSMSLVLSMTLRFVPRFQTRLHAIVQSQKGMGQDVAEGTLVQRIRKMVMVLSILVTWALESAIDTADSMKSRGHGLPGRTAFSVYRMDERDKGALVWLFACGWMIVSGWVSGNLGWRYFPTLQGAAVTPLTAGIHLAYLALCLTPVMIDQWEERKWKHLTSKI